ncbi:MAG TPA: NAD-dependent protein deacylase [Anaerolineae bacterium]|nr:NAD-dependent protein deacylase [Caldilineae bacterium]HID33938.1 NAD-dependent protein deacylase [Anaerolineae bacterium]HIQ12595.1 NAD-dependent protein deacylase [Caldilineales bacterium]
MPVFRRRASSPSPASIQEELQRALALLSEAQRVVVLTGAGVSTPSGIPDFRSDSTGLWSFANPFEVASLWAFQERPQRFYQWLQPLAADILQARPNPAHVTLAEMERKGVLSTVITQNIDGLHQVAGSQRVLEIHGHLRQVHCLDCGWEADSQPYLEAFLHAGELPICPQCGHVLKPKVVLFGEALPHDVVVAAQEAALHSDLMLVAGSSLEVMPAADLPALAVRSGSRLIIATLGMTPYDHLADVLLRGDVAQTLPWLAARL